jgi:hypothetical protein
MVDGRGRHFFLRSNPSEIEHADIHLRLRRLYLERVWR